MKSLWNDADARAFAHDPLGLRVYSSRLLGQIPQLVLHGGGNTSVKMAVTNLFGESIEVLYIKGSGWDLGTIQAAGFAPVRMDVLLKLATIPDLSDTVIGREQRMAMLDPSAPNPSVEAILHALIPFKFVDHTHADAVVALTNNPQGEATIREVYGKRVLIVPYVMPGFILARTVYEMTQGIDWSTLDGIILMNHGIFTFHDDARTSYEMMIRLVTEAENYLEQKGAFQNVVVGKAEEPDLLTLSRIRRVVSDTAGKPMIVQMDQRPQAVGFANLPNVESLATRGLLTPDHVIRTKRIPVVIGDDLEADIARYAEAYQAYYLHHATDNLTMRDPAPRWAVWKGQGILNFGETVKAAGIAGDITRQTIEVIQWVEAFSTWQPLSEKAIFEVEYWELEQAKLRKGGSSPVFQGKVALVTGAASGIGRACAEALKENGAVVIAVDINPQIVELFNDAASRGMVCDLTDPADILRAVEGVVRTFGGLDILISNAGIFPDSRTIEAMDTDLWDRSMAINLTSHQRVLQASIPYLRNGIDPAVVIIGSKNYPAPGPGAGAYSVAKAGLTQLARVAALELAKSGIRVNVIHPDAVFDTGIWTEEIISKRATNYGLTVEQYKTKNLLGVQIKSRDVAELACVMAGPVFRKTTGAQVPIDGGNDRVI
jgi:rhamnose utilization protein RhaD (predicted bifunctional aldolase and dehydrogenase)/NAD(P)-dependent dehydrogenase (short-subunit alcohol dehydrogenase family)